MLSLALLFAFRDKSILQNFRKYNLLCWNRIWFIGPTNYHNRQSNFKIKLDTFKHIFFE